MLAGDAPIAVRVTHGMLAGELVAGWSLTAATPAVEITDYAVQVSADAGASWQRVADGISALRHSSLKNLDPAREYLVRVAARTGSQTQGPWSAPSAAVRPRPFVPFVHVGNPGNAANPEFRIGDVAYEYRIGTYEITIAQYVEFLNAVAATDPTGLYYDNPEFRGFYMDREVRRSGGPGYYTYAAKPPEGLTPPGADSSGDRPIVNVGPLSAARFANWMSNGRPKGGQTAATTEDGAYALNGMTSGRLPARNAINPNTQAPPAYFIPTENEWYKAAAYSPLLAGGAGGYFLYATRSNDPPGNRIGAAANQANYGRDDVFAVTQSSVLQHWGQNYLTNVGAFTGSASFYGTFDQTGNAAERIDTQGRHSFDLAGGSYLTRSDPVSGLYATSRSAAIPDPSSWTGLRLAGSSNRPALLALLAGPPAALRATSVAEGVRLDWKPPAARGGSAISGYRIQSSTDGGATWSDVQATRSSATTATLADPPRNVALVFRVAAVNASGPGGFSAASNAVVLRYAADACEPNGTPAEATALGGVPVARTLEGLTIHQLGERDHFELHLAAGGAAGDQVVLRFPSSRGELDLRLLDQQGGVLALAQTAAEGKSLSLAGRPAGSYWLEVRGRPGVRNGYSLELFLPVADLRAVAGTVRGELWVDWNSPAVPRGRSIIGYRLQVSSDAGHSWRDAGTAAGSDSYAVLRNLDPSLACLVRVATVLDGDAVGRWSAPSAAVRPQAAAEFVRVGDPGNAPHTTGLGAVAREFDIGIHEVTISQYTEFLNAVAARDPYGLFNPAMRTDLNSAGIARSGAPGAFTYSVVSPAGATPAGAQSAGSRPITYVSWPDAARYVNWVSNGRPRGAAALGTTEDGAYAVRGETRSFMPPPRNAVNPNTGSAPTVWLPSLDEWYKAAYFSPTKNGAGSPGYYLYATQSDSKPGNTIGAAANQANFWNATFGPIDGGAPWGWRGPYAVTGATTKSDSQNYLTEVGAFSSSRSFYGTLDQTGNVAERVENSEGQTIGGGWNSSDITSRGSNFGDSSLRYESDETSAVGFRIAGAYDPEARAATSLPAAPSSPRGVAGGGSVSLTWSAPAFTGGRPISHFILEQSADDGATWTEVSRPRSATTAASVTGLAAGRRYLFRVAAVTTAGPGGFSTASPAFRV